MKRGDVVTVIAPGAYGKPRPAIVVQSDILNAEHTSVLVVLLTSTLVDAPLFRLTVLPTPANGLQKPSQAMVDRVVALPKDRVGAVIGQVDEATLLALSRALAFVLGLG